MKFIEIHIHIHIPDETKAAGISEQIRAATELLSRSSSKLSTALGSTAPAGAPGTTPTSEERSMDPLSQAVADLTAAVEAETTVADSAIKYIQSVPALIDAAVAADVNNGALPQNLASITGLASKLRSEADAIQAALSTNTVPAPMPDPVPVPDPTPVPDPAPTPDPVPVDDPNP